MNLRVQRKYVSPLSTTGELSIDGQFFCFTLEPPPDRAHYPSIPAGTYPVVMLKSQRFNRVMPHVINVPGRSQIEIHWGNEAQDTEGCLLVGKTLAADWVGDSRTAWKALMDRLQGQESIVCQYLDAGSPGGSLAPATGTEEAPPDIDSEISV